MFENRFLFQIRGTMDYPFILSLFLVALFCWVYRSCIQTQRKRKHTPMLPLETETVSVLEENQDSTFVQMQPREDWTHKTSGYIVQESQGENGFININIIKTDASD